MKNLVLRFPPKFNFFEVHELDDDPSSREVWLVITRNNSYPIHKDHEIVYELLERLGIKVVVRVGLQDLTLEQFKMYGQYVPGTGRVSKTALASQGFYNMKSQLNKLQKELQALGDGHPQYDLIVRKISTLKSMLASAEPEITVSEEALEASNKALEALIAMIEKQPKQGDNNEQTKPTSTGQAVVTTEDGARES